MTNKMRCRRQLIQLPAAGIAAGLAQAISTLLPHKASAAQGHASATKGHASGLGAAPDFTLASRNGDLTLSTVDAKLIYLDFWASWCAPCRLSFPWMQSMHERYGPAGLKILAVCLDQDRSQANRFLDASKPAFAILFNPNGDVAASYDVKTMPSSFLVRPRSLAVLARHAGFRVSDQANLEAVIKSHLLS